MPIYRVRASHTVTCGHSAEVEVDAVSRVAAIQVAQILDLQGRLTWREQDNPSQTGTVFVIADKPEDDGLQGRVSKILEAAGVPESVICWIMTLMAKAEAEEFERTQRNG